VLGLEVGEARVRLEEVGLDVEIGTAITSTEYPDGTIARQSVPGGREVRTGTDVVLRPSKGLPLVTVPSLLGLRQKQAERALGDADLVPGEVTLEFSETVPKGKVIEQNPNPDARIEFGEPVNFVVSKGPEPIPVPNVLGLGVDEATAVLTSAQLEVSVTEEYSTEVEAGKVISQQPGPEDQVRRGTTVSIVVSLGPEEFEMPNVTGDETGDAEAELRALGLDVQTIVLPGSDGSHVVFQDPEPGVTVRQGDVVKIYVA
jgi:serine/threonine-protein kinase